MVEESRYRKRFDSKIKNLNNKFYDVGGEKHNLRDFLIDAELMRAFVEERPYDAFALHGRAMMWKYAGSEPTGEISLFLAADRVICKAFKECYRGNPEYVEMVNDVLKNMDNKRMDNNSYYPSISKTAERNSSGTRGKNSW